MRPIQSEGHNLFFRPTFPRDLVTTDFISPRGMRLGMTETVTGNRAQVEWNRRARHRPLDSVDALYFTAFSDDEPVVEKQEGKKKKADRNWVEKKEEKKEKSRNVPKKVAPAPVQKENVPESPEGRAFVQYLREFI